MCLEKTILEIQDRLISGLAEIGDIKKEIRKRVMLKDRDHETDLDLIFQFYAVSICLTDMFKVGDGCYDFTPLKNEKLQFWLSELLDAAVDFEDTIKTEEGDK